MITKTVALVLLTGALGACSQGNQSTPSVHASMSADVSNSTLDGAKDTHTTPIAQLDTVVVSGTVAEEKPFAVVAVGSGGTAGKASGNTAVTPGDTNASVDVGEMNNAPANSDTSEPTTEKTTETSDAEDAGATNTTGVGSDISATANTNVLGQ